MKYLLAFLSTITIFSVPLILAGCGGGGPTTTTNSGPTTTPQTCCRGNNGSTSTYVIIQIGASDSLGVVCTPVRAVYQCS